jgi:hypothetical protein
LARQNIEVARTYASEVVARRMLQVFRRDLSALGVRSDVEPHSDG